MAVIDGQGRLFGYVNVVDALVVMLAVALVTAGAALVVGDGSSGEPASSPVAYVEITATGVDASVGQLVDPGDEFAVAQRTGAESRILDTDVARTGPDTVTVRLLAAVPDGSVRAGESIAVETAAYRIEGTVTDRRSSRSGVAIDRTRVRVELALSAVSPAVADDIERGMTVRRNGGVVARVTAVEVEPATVVVESDDGQLFARNHPVNEDVTLTVALDARRTARGLWFNDRPLGVGRDLRLYFNETTVEGTVTGVQRTG